MNEQQESIVQFTQDIPSFEAAISCLQGVERSLSLSDFLFKDGKKDDDFISAYQHDMKCGNVDKLSPYLWDVGIDRHPIRVTENITHRNARGMVVKCPMFQGMERRDSEWMKSGNASMDALIGYSEEAVRVDMILSQRTYDWDKQTQMLEENSVLCVGKKPSNKGKSKAKGKQ